MMKMKSSSAIKNCNVSLFSQSHAPRGRDFWNVHQLSLELFSNSPRLLQVFFFRYIELTLWWTCTMNFGENYFWTYLLWINFWKCGEINFWIEPTWRPRGVSGFCECYLRFIEATLWWTCTLNCGEINLKTWWNSILKWAIMATTWCVRIFFFTVKLFPRVDRASSCLFIADCFFNSLVIYCKSILWISHV